MAVNPAGRLGEWVTGKREPKGVSTFRNFADGLACRAPRARARQRGPVPGTRSEDGR
jgi:hypothetical protein